MEIIIIKKIFNKQLISYEINVKPDEATRTTKDNDRNEQGNDENGNY